MASGYLVWLGVQLLRHPRSAFAIGTGPDARRTGWFARGLLQNLLNPKVGVF